MTYFLAILLKVPQNSPELTLEQNLHYDALQQLSTRKTLTNAD